MKVHLNPTRQILSRIGINEEGKVQKFYTDTCYKHMDKYVPKDTGNLRDNVDKGIDYIEYESPYAHAQYVGFTKGEVRNYTTPGTGPYWDKRMVSAEMKDIEKEVQRYLEYGN
jgi:hypothetical protein